MSTALIALGLGLLAFIVIALFAADAWHRHREYGIGWLAIIATALVMVIVGVVGYVIGRVD